MSNDLISRSAVLDIIKKHECDTSRIAEGVLDLPTVYDVDKVVEQMEKFSFVPGDRRGVSEVKIIMADKALDIVKAEMKG